MTTLAQTKSKVKTYRTIEVVTSIAETEIGDFVANTIEARGTTKAAIKKQPRLIIGNQTKCCLANWVKGLPEATTIVHIPMVSKEGIALEMGQWMQAYWFACHEFGVPLWTQSSIKGLTFYFIPPEMFERLADKWDRENDGARFMAYIGLLFSEMDGDLPLSITVRKVEDPADGEDGNSLMPIEFWGKRACQFRAMRLDPKGGLPIGLGKGIGVPMKDVSRPGLNSTQIKFGKAGKYLVLRNKSVGWSRSGGPIRMWISAEPLLMLVDHPTVRQFCAARVQREVADYLSLLNEENFPALLKRLHGLTLLPDGTLESAKQAVIDAIRSKMPACREIEERVTRFAIKEICESIIPSGGIEGRASLMVISDTAGVGPCAWKDAKVVAFRIPLVGQKGLIPLPKNPYVKGKGNVVISEVAMLADGDSDGDLLVVVSDPEVVELFRVFHNPKIDPDLKPDKKRAKAALTRQFVEESTIDQVANAWQVGTLTVNGWKAIQEKDWKSASELLELANIQPMTVKWQMEFNGVPFDEAVNHVLGRLRTRFSEVHLGWREMQPVARGWVSPRSLAESEIADPKSHLDVAWNAAVKAAKWWDESNPLKPLSLSKVARIAFGEIGLVIPGSAWREQNAMKREWGEYWAANDGAQGDHSFIYHRAAEWGRHASPEAIAAMLVWRPQNPESTGFALKWHSVFAAGRGAEVLGLRPNVAQAIMEMQTPEQASIRLDALINPLVDAILL